ncbi:MAG: GDSL-type esterase/lipase family protein, partial [Pseudomonadota bacterium]
MTTRTILCFGDSNTHGTISMRELGERRRHEHKDRWTSVMAKQLGHAWRVIDEGHPGRTAVYDDPIEGEHKNGHRMIKAILESHRPLDLVIVLLGTNDLKARFGAAPGDVSLGVQRIVLEIMNSDCGPSGRAPGVLVAAPVSVQEKGVLAKIFAGAEEKSQSLPDALKEMAARNAVEFVDLNAIAAVNPVDGVHLEKDAHLAIGTTLAGKILR